MLVNLQISGAALAYIVRRNSGLKYLNARGCKNLFQQESNARGIEFSSYPCAEPFPELGRTCKLEEIVLGWGFSFLSLEVLKPAITSLHSITVGLGGSFGEEALRLLPTTCPMLESVVLYFQVVLKKLRYYVSGFMLYGLCMCFEYHESRNLCHASPSR